MEIVCLDLEGVLIPEVWIAFAEKTGIDDLRATTRDIPDYNILMKQRLEILEKNNFLLKDIQAVISSLEPLPGAKAFLDWLRERFQLVILSDKQSEINNIFYAEGNVSVSYRGKLLKADNLIYDKFNKKIVAQGNVALIIGSQLFKV